MYNDNFIKLLLYNCKMHIMGKMPDYVVCYNDYSRQFCKNQALYLIFAELKIIPSKATIKRSEKAYG